MTRFQFSVVLLLTLMFGFGISLVASIGMLPPRVATHFDATGTPDGWMSRSQHLIFMAVFGIAFPLFVVGMCWSARYLPTSAINIPHRDYWLSAERRTESTDYMFHHSIWLGCLGSLFATSLHWAVVFSNQRQPVGLPLSWILTITVLFLISVVTWVVCLHRRFSNPIVTPTSPIATAS